MNLPVTQLQLATEMAAQGLGEASIREALGLSPAEFKDLTKAPRPGELAPLTQAIADGKSRILEAALSVIIAGCQNGDKACAKWLAERYGGSKKDDDGNIKGFFINLTLPLSPEEYHRQIAEVVEDE